MEFHLETKKINGFKITKIKPNIKNAGWSISTITVDSINHLASIKAFAGARYSRSSDSIESILGEILQSDKDANEKLGVIFSKYGHASVGDMAEVFVFFENVPMYIATLLFHYMPLGAGQERSTRYQVHDSFSSEIKSLDYYINPEDIENFKELNTQFQDLQKHSIESLQLLYPKAYAQLKSHFKISLAKNPSQESCLKSRTLDTVRGFILNGINTFTSFAINDSARNFGNLIATLSGSHNPEVKNIILALKELLAPTELSKKELDSYVPEVSELIRHTDPITLGYSNLHKVQTLILPYLSEILDTKATPKRTSQSVKLLTEYTPSERLIIGEISRIYPHLKYNALGKVIKSLDEKLKQQILEVLIKGYDHHLLMPSWFSTRQFCYEITTSIAEMRDWNRHRSIIQHNQSHQEMLNSAPNIFIGEFVLPLYLTDIPELANSEVTNLYIQRQKEYYKKLQLFWELAKNTAKFPHYILPQLYNFAHATRLVMEIDLHALNYTVNLRSKPGGHINYISTSYAIMNQLITKFPEYASLELPINDIFSKANFLSRK